MNWWKTSFITSALFSLRLLKTHLFLPVFARTVGGSVGRVDLSLTFRCNLNYQVTVTCLVGFNERRMIITSLGRFQRPAVTMATQGRPNKHQEVERVEMALVGAVLMKRVVVVNVENKLTRVEMSGLTAVKPHTDRFV